MMAWQDTPPTDVCQARLELVHQNNMLTVTGHCKNLTMNNERYRYELTLERKSDGGHSQNSQSGEFDAAPQQEVVLSQSSINASAQDDYTIYLHIFDLQGHKLAQDSAIQHASR